MFSEYYTTTIDPEQLAMKGLTSLANTLEKISDCQSTVKYLDGYNLAVFMKGGNFVIWTETELTAGAQVALQDAIENSGYDNLADLGEVGFAYGFGTFQLNGKDIPIKDDGTIIFEGKNAWSWFYRGNVALEQDTYDVTVTNTYVPPVEYQWIQTGEDSATGYDPNGKIKAKGNWFMYNTLDVAAMEVGDTQTFDVQAGNDKNGTNFVGTYTVTKVADGQFQISYAVNTLDANHKIVVDGYHLWINDTGKFENSPGNQKGKAVAVAADSTFNFSGDTLNVFAHFDVSYWALVEVEL